MHRQGLGVQTDYAEAMRLYNKARLQGNVIAIFNIGYMHEMGYGVPKDVNLAVRHYRDAAAKGSVDAQKRLKDLGY
ncbi:MAG: sel1 repeat family protein [Acidobacteria bacterium]|nr:sel1 repeat family protein [Acidobacteriota bacterium]